MPRSSGHVFDLFPGDTGAAASRARGGALHGRSLPPRTLPAWTGARPRVVSRWRLQWMERASASLGTARRRRAGTVASGPWPRAPDCGSSTARRSRPTCTGTQTVRPAAKVSPRSKSLTPPPEPTRRKSSWRSSAGREEIFKRAGPATCAAKNVGPIVRPTQRQVFGGVPRRLENGL